MANNNSEIPPKDLRELMEIVSDNYFLIISKWKQHFPTKILRFYC